MSGFTVEKNIPMPKDARGRFSTGKSKYPWRSMEIGDSFLMPKDGANPHGVAHILSKRATAECGSRRRFKAAQIADGWRIWRTE